MSNKQDWEVAWERDYPEAAARIARNEFQAKVTYDTTTLDTRDAYEAGYREGAAAPVPIPMRIPCPDCGELHIDKGKFATKPHHTHSCQNCGLTWRPAVEPTVGVRFLPGFKDEPESTEPSELERLKAERDQLLVRISNRESVNDNLRVNNAALQEQILERCREIVQLKSELRQSKDPVHHINCVAGLVKLPRATATPNSEKGSSPDDQETKTKTATVEGSLDHEPHRAD